MSEEEKKERRVVKRQSDPGFVSNLVNQIRLVLRLMADPRVNFLLKLLPVGALGYLIVPDMIPFIIDDALVLGLGTYMFIELCPDDIVEEHKNALWEKDNEATGKVVDAEFFQTPEEDE
jgi:uncharacterized membrane protein YkvA (DUF1232 family)